MVGTRQAGRRLGRAKQASLAGLLACPLLLLLLTGGGWLVCAWCVAVMVSRQPKKAEGEVDLYRDTWVRYFGYFNEVRQTAGHRAQREREDSV